MATQVVSEKCLRLALAALAGRMGLLEVKGAARLEVPPEALAAPVLVALWMAVEARERKRLAAAAASAVP
jgi:hypothetical protein